MRTLNRALLTQEEICALFLPSNPRVGYPGAACHSGMGQEWALLTRVRNGLLS